MQGAPALGPGVRRFGPLTEDPNSPLDRAHARDLANFKWSSLDSWERILGENLDNLLGTHFTDLDAREREEKAEHQLWLDTVQDTAK